MAMPSYNAMVNSMDDEQRRALRDALMNPRPKPPRVKRRLRAASEGDDEFPTISLNAETSSDGAERPLAFNGQMVRALLDGRKHVTRRPVQPAPLELRDGMPMARNGNAMKCPLGTPGDVLWVREKWARDEAGEYHYAADPASTTAEIVRWRGGMAMPRSAARLRLTITAIHAEPVQNITADQTLAEGCPPEHEGDPIAWFRDLWQYLYSKTEHRWSANPAVWVIAFDRQT